MSKSERHEQILRLLDECPRIEITDLAERLDTSEITARRDIAELAARGHVERAHGAVLRAAFGRSTERPFHVREQQSVVEKEAIAAAAAELMVDGSAVALDVGSTVLAVIPHLGHLTGLTFVTANLRTAREVTSSTVLRRPYRLIVAGGLVREEELSMSGGSTLDQLRSMRTDVALIGVAGVSVGAGLTDFNVEDAEVKRVLISSSKQRVVLADHTKLEQERFAQVADISQVDVLITDEKADPGAVREFRAAGVDVRIAPYRKVRSLDTSGPTGRG